MPAKAAELPHPGQHVSTPTPAPFADLGAFLTQLSVPRVGQPEKAALVFAVDLTLNCQV